MFKLHTIRLIFIGLVLIPLTASAGNLDSQAPPDDTSSAMHNLNDVYNRLNDGTSGSKRGGNFTEPILGPLTATGHTLDEIMNLAPLADNVDGAIPSQVLSGKKYWGLSTDPFMDWDNYLYYDISDLWGLQSGAMPDNGAIQISPGRRGRSIPKGYHNGQGRIDGDANLLPGNIKSGITLFGVAGKCKILPATGYTASEFAGDDGTFDYGCLPNVAPRDGFNRTYLGWKPSAGTGLVDNLNGSVYDTLTGLTWLKNANCFGLKTFQDALNVAAGLASNGCGLTDDSVAGDWRLPNANEIRSLMTSVPVSSLRRLVGPMFINYVTADWTNKYWTGTTRGYYLTPSNKSYSVALASFYYGYAKFFSNALDTSQYVWPVRGGQ